MVGTRGCMYVCMHIPGIYLFLSRSVYTFIYQSISLWKSRPAVFSFVTQGSLLSLGLFLILIGNINGEIVSFLSSLDDYTHIHKLVDRLQKLLIPNNCRQTL